MWISLKCICGRKYNNRTDLKLKIVYLAIMVSLKVVESFCLQSVLICNAFFVIHGL